MRALTIYIILSSAFSSAALAGQKDVGKEPSTWQSIVSFYESIVLPLERAADVLRKEAEELLRRENSRRNSGIIVLDEESIRRSTNSRERSSNPLNVVTRDTYLLVKVLRELNGQRFERINVSGVDLDCFPNAVGLTREQMFQALLNNLDKEFVIEAIVNEIILNLTESPEIFDIEFLKLLGFLDVEDAKETMQMALDNEDLIKMYKSKASHKDVLKLFLQNHFAKAYMPRVGAKGEKYIIDAIAKLFGFSLRVYTINNTSTDLQLTHSYETEGEMVSILLNRNHFQFLKPISDKEANAIKSKSRWKIKGTDAAFSEDELNLLRDILPAEWLALFLSSVVTKENTKLNKVLSETFNLLTKDKFSAGDFIIIDRKEDWGFFDEYSYYKRSIEIKKCLLKFLKTAGKKGKAEEARMLLESIFLSVLNSPIAQSSYEINEALLSVAVDFNSNAIIPLTEQLKKYDNSNDTERIKLYGSYFDGSKITKLLSEPTFTIKNADKQFEYETKQQNHLVRFIALLKPCLKNPYNFVIFMNLVEGSYKATLDGYQVAFGQTVKILASRLKENRGRLTDKSDECISNESKKAANSVHATQKRTIKVFSNMWIALMEYHKKIVDKFRISLNFFDFLEPILPPEEKIIEEKTFEEKLMENILILESDKFEKNYDITEQEIDFKEIDDQKDEHEIDEMLMKHMIEASDQWKRDRESKKEKKIFVESKKEIKSEEVPEISDMQKKANELKGDNRETLERIFSTEGANRRVLTKIKFSSIENLLSVFGATIKGQYEIWYKGKRLKSFHTTHGKDGFLYEVAVALVRAALELMGVKKP